MNQNTRKALIKSIATDAENATTTDHFVQIATHMVDSSSQGRTDRWKDACELAGDLILDEYNDAGKVHMTCAADAVAVGLLKMTQANK